MNANVRFRTIGLQTPFKGQLLRMMNDGSWPTKHALVNMSQ
jgi:hypothetical protein